MIIQASKESFVAIFYCALGLDSLLDLFLLSVKMRLVVGVVVRLFVGGDFTHSCGAGIPLCLERVLLAITEHPLLAVELLDLFDQLLLAAIEFAEAPFFPLRQLQWISPSLLHNTLIIYTQSFSSCLFAYSFMHIQVGLPSDIHRKSLLLFFFDFHKFPL